MCGLVVTAQRVTAHEWSLGGGLIDHAGWQWNFDHLFTQHDFKRMVRRERGKRDEDLCAPMFFRLDPQNLRRIRGPHEFADGDGGDPPSLSHLTP